MADPFVAEIRIFPFNFAPKGWAFCDGQLLPLSQNTALFSLLGTMYGGDGKSNFALPNMQGNAPMFWGQGPGLSLHDEGEMSGTETVTLLESEIPSHSHSFTISQGPATTPSPSGSLVAKGGWDDGTNAGVVATYIANVTPTTTMNPLAVGPTGGDQPHNNMMPYLTLNFCIALQGVFPPRG